MAELARDCMPRLLASPPAGTRDGALKQPTALKKSRTLSRLAPPLCLAGSVLLHAGTIAVLTLIIAGTDSAMPGPEPLSERRPTRADSACSEEPPPPPSAEEPCNAPTREQPERIDWHAEYAQFEHASVEAPAKLRDLGGSAAPTACATAKRSDDQAGFPLLQTDCDWSNVRTKHGPAAASGDGPAGVIGAGGFERKHAWP